MHIRISTIKETISLSFTFAAARVGCCWHLSLASLQLSSHPRRDVSSCLPATLYLASKQVQRTGKGAIQLCQRCKATFQVLRSALHSSRQQRRKTKTAGGGVALCNCEAYDAEVVGTIKTCTGVTTRSRAAPKQAVAELASLSTSEYRIAPLRLAITVSVAECPALKGKQ